MGKTIYPGYLLELKNRIFENSNLLQVLLGARQVGKTTSVLRLIEDHFPNDSIYISADDVFNPDSSWLREHWQEAQSEKKVLFIDEIQRVYNWSNTIKSLYDQSLRNKNAVRCVVLGSSSLEIQKGLNESMTGRFQLTRAHHWNFEESQSGYGLDFEKYLQYGGYPGSYKLIGTNNWIDYVKTSIVGTVIDKDILQFQTVKNPALFRQAFDILVSYPAQEISYTKLLGQLQDKGNVELVKYYISLYEGAYLLKALSKFSNKQHLQKASSPKILPLAPCLPYLRSRTEYNSADRGRIFETLVGSQLIRTGEDLFYWREGKYEVDFVLKIGAELWAIEVKSSRVKKTSGVEQFARNFPKAKIVFITEKNYFEFEKNPLAFLKKLN